MLRIHSALLAIPVAIAAANSTCAAVILNVLINPTSTAGGGATSTRSGAGTFQVYAIDDNPGTFGIGSYNMTMGAAVTASNNRSPSANIGDANGDPQSAGFTLLRSAANANPMTGAQNLPGQTPYLIKGFGRTAGDFCTVAGGACAAVFPNPLSQSWGGPYNNGLGDYNGKKWVFLAEGAYNQTALPAATPQALITAATFTVYGNANDFSQIASTTSFVPEPTIAALAGLALFSLASVARRRR